MNKSENNGSLTIAGIDDHEIIGHGIQTIFHAHDESAIVLYFPSLAQMNVTPDVLILDLRLADGSTPADNLAVCNDRQIPVVVYTSGDNPDLIRQAIAHGALSVIRKSISADVIIESVKAAARGETTPGLDWAAAMDADEDFVSQHLTVTEADVLTHYASGELSDSVARKLNMSPGSVTTYINRVRNKYRKVGRRVDSRVDLFLRAAEDGLVSYFGNTN